MIIKFITKKWELQTVKDLINKKARLLTGLIICSNYTANAVILLRFPVAVRSAAQNPVRV